MAYTLITGASSGIGAQTAIQLSSQYDLILCGRDKNRLNETLNKCNHQERHLIWQYDLSHISELEAELCTFIKTNGIEINQFVHCAGIGTLMPVKNYNLDDMNEMMAINFYSAAIIIKLLIRKKTNNKQLKNVVIISSVNSQYGISGNSFYSITKNACNSFIRSLAVEQSDILRANCILPGYIDTPMTNNPNIKNSNHSIQMLENTPLGIGQTTDVANMVEFLLSDKSRWITGQQFVVDGGYTA